MWPLFVQLHGTHGSQMDCCLQGSIGRHCLHLDRHLLTLRRFFATFFNMDKMGESDCGSKSSFNCCKNGSLLSTTKAKRTVQCLIAKSTSRQLVGAVPPCRHIFQIQINRFGLAGTPAPTVHLKRNLFKRSEIRLSPTNEMNRIVHESREDSIDAVRFAHRHPTRIARHFLKLKNLYGRRGEVKPASLSQSDIGNNGVGVL